MRQEAVAGFREHCTGANAFKQRGAQLSLKKMNATADCRLREM
jgi:hypothetical protein